MNENKSKPNFDGKSSYYENIIPLEKEVASVTVITMDGYNIEIKEYGVCK